MSGSNETGRIDSGRAPEPVGLYPHARRVGNLLFLSGVGPRERGTRKIPGVELDAAGNIASYDIETQCRSVFNNVRAIDCSGSNYRYSAWKKGHRYVVRVNRDGDITRIRRAD